MYIRLYQHYEELHFSGCRVRIGSKLIKVLCEMSKCTDSCVLREKASAVVEHIIGTATMG